MNGTLGQQHTVLATQPGVVMQRPKISPYTAQSVTLRLGPGRKEYYVSSGLLQNQTWIDAASWGGVQLPDIDENTGHILVHYLYTGTYQTLDNTEDSAVEDAHIEFRRAFSAYIMANTYQLTGLQQLAMSKIEYFGRDMTVFDIVAAIDEDFSRLPESAIGFKEYLIAKAENAFEKDHTVFLEDGTFDRITSVELSKILAKGVMQLYRNKVTHMIQSQGSIYQSYEEPKGTTNLEANGEEVRSGDALESTGNVEPEEGKTQEPLVVEEVALPAGQELAVDGWGVFASTSTGKKKKGKKGLRQGLKDEALPPPSPDPVPEPELETVQGDFLKTSTKLELMPESEPAPAEDPWSFGVTTSKKKKKKAAFESPAEPEPAPQPEPVEEEQPLPAPAQANIHDPWGSVFAPSTSKKKKKKGKTAVEEPPPPPPPETELVPEVEPAQVDVPLPLSVKDEPSPAPEQVNDNESSALWGAATFPFNKKKKKSKMIVEEPQVEGPPSPPPPEPPTIEEQKDVLAPTPEIVVETHDNESVAQASPALHSKKSKKKPSKQKALSPELVPEPPVVEVDTVQAPNGKEEPKSVSISGRDSEFCPARVEHLFESDGWRGCNMCRAWLGQASAELVLTR